MQTAIHVFRKLRLDVSPSAQKKLANTCMTLLDCEEKRCQSCQRLIIDIRATIQKFLHYVLILRIRIYCIHERSSFLLVFVIDKGFIVKQILHQFEVALLAGHHQSRLSLVGFLRVYVRTGLNQQLTALDRVFKFRCRASFDCCTERHI